MVREVVVTVAVAADQGAALVRACRSGRAEAAKDHDD